MARGVSQDDITQAADALLAAGERPTVERVRAALGRGSPNTIGPLLDSWWAQLAQRLTQRDALPAIPDPIGAAFAQIWEVAVTAARAEAEAQVAPERAALAEVLATADEAVAAERTARAVLETQLATARGDAATSHAALVKSDQRNSDLQRQIASQQAELQALSVRLDATLSRHHYVVLQAESERTAAAAERETLQAQVRQIEDRAYTEVDHSRQEIKSLKSQLAAQTRDHSSALRASDQARRAAEIAQSKAELEVSALQARLARVAGKTPATKKKPTAAPLRRQKKA
jgi:chromosome segregation ATPase